MARGIIGGVVEEWMGRNISKDKEEEKEEKEKEKKEK